MSDAGDEFSRARAGDMEAAILEAVETLTGYRDMSEIRAAHDRLLALADEIGDARDGHERDHMVYAEATCTRTGKPFQAVVGAVVDGRPEKPGAILSHLTSRGDWSEVGVSNIEHARAVIEAMHLAWPELREEHPARLEAADDLRDAVWRYMDEWGSGAGALEFVDRFIRESMGGAYDRAPVLFGEEPTT